MSPGPEPISRLGPDATARQTAPTTAAATPADPYRPADCQ